MEYRSRGGGPQLVNLEAAQRGLGSEVTLRYSYRRTLKAGHRRQHSNSHDRIR